MRKQALYIAFGLSGVAGLGYELAWTRMFTVGLGHELPSVLAVVTAFFAGIALGAWWLDGPVSRSRVPGRWYAGAEIVAGSWALASILVIPWVNARLAGLMGPDPSALRQWAVALLVPLVVLSPATVAMGATLPAIDRLCCRLRHSGRSVGGLYAVNTCGAVLGILLAAYLLVPRLGYRGALMVLASFSVLSGLLILLGPARLERGREEVLDPLPDAPGPWALRGLLLATGLLGIGYEVLGVRVMGQVLENTIFSFASALGIYLLGTAVGAAAYQWMGSKLNFRALLSVLLSLLAASTALGIVVLGRSSAIYESARAALGAGFAGSVLAEMVLAAAVFGLPTLLMGATFSHLAQAARRHEGGVGLALSVNTLGSALAPVVFGVLLLPALGSKLALVVIAAGYVALLPRFRMPHHAVVVAAVLGVAILAPDLLLVKPGHGYTVRVAREGIRATVAVTEGQVHPGHTSPTRLLMVNNRFRMGGTGQGVFLQQRQAHVPLLLHAAPRRVLFLGLGTGITFAAVEAHAGVAGDGIELLPEVVEVMPEFREANQALYDLPRLSVHTADARRFVQACQTDYDVIVADLFHPARDGAGSLYTVEHFRVVRDRLAEDGLFCQWLPLYQVDPEVFRIIVRSFLTVFPEARAWWGYFNVNTPVLGLIGERQPRRFTAGWYDRRVVSPDLSAAAYRAGLRNGLQLLGCFAADAGQLAAFAGQGPLNSDDHPVVAFRSPAHVYRKDRPGYANMLDLLQAVPGRPAALLEPGDAAFAERLTGYIRARNLYFRASILLVTGQGGDAQDLLVDSVAASTDFRTAYDTALLMAQQMRDRQAVMKLLLRLQQANPGRPEAGELLQQLR